MWLRLTSIPWYMYALFGPLYHLHTPLLCNISQGTRGQAYCRQITVLFRVENQSLLYLAIIWFYTAFTAKSLRWSPILIFLMRVCHIINKTFSQCSVFTLQHYKSKPSVSPDRPTVQSDLKVNAFCCCNCLKKPWWNCTGQTVGIWCWNTSDTRQRLSLHARQNTAFI